MTAREAYKTVRDDIVLLQHWCCHLGVLVVVVLDEVFIAHAGFLLHQDGGLDYFPESSCVWVAGFEDHGR